MIDKRVRVQFVADVRAVADFFEQHPEVPLPFMPVDFDIYGVDDPAELATIVRACGNIVKSTAPEHNLLRLKHKVGEFCQIGVISPLNTVCRRVVTGTRVVPSQTLPALTLPERTEEIVEWECGSIFEGGRQVELPESERRDISPLPATESNQEGEDQ